VPTMPVNSMPAVACKNNKISKNNKRDLEILIGINKQNIKRN
jgi:hypothetical protein